MSLMLMPRPPFTGVRWRTTIEEGCVWAQYAPFVPALPLQQCYCSGPALWPLSCTTFVRVDVDVL